MDDAFNMARGNERSVLTEDDVSVLAKVENELDENGKCQSQSNLD